MPDKGISYQLKTVEIVDFSLIQKPADFTGDEFHFDITAESKVSQENKLLFAVTTVAVRDLDKPTQLSKLVTAIGFYIVDFEESIVLDPEVNRYLIPDDLELHTRTIGVSTTRGILYSQLRGTYLGKAILPVVPQMAAQNAEQFEKQKAALSAVLEQK